MTNLLWKRPKSMRVRSKQKKWTPEQDSYILTHSLKDSMEYLDRTEQSVKLRLWRLKNST